jgi:prepilin-type N-terminal cleavage/methylation domain-containing protein
MKMSRGFTLIELLVVVAIIGMLSSIVLASMASARNKASDAAVKSNLRTLTVQAAFYQSNRGNYGTSVSAGTCPTSGTSMFYADQNIRNALQEAGEAGGGATRCATNGTDFAVSVQLRSSSNHWCVDSESAVKEITNTSWSGTACP